MRGTVRSTLIVAGLAFGSIVIATPSRADIFVQKCVFPDVSFFLTRYSDGTPARIGRISGVGSKALYFKDRYAEVFIEIDLAGIPITFTTIFPDLTAIHSRHSIVPLGDKVVPPSQSKGKCTNVPI